MPHEPLDRFFDRLVSDVPMSRREVLRRLAATGLAVGGAGTLLSACGDVGGAATTTAATTAAVRHPPGPIDEVVFSNWPLYIDRKVLKGWERRYDARLRYLEDINDNEEFLAKVRPDLEAGRSTGRDLVALTDYMAARWVHRGWVEPLDRRNIPNAKNLQPALATIAFDPGRRFSLPYQAGISGYGYDIKRTGREITSAEDLFDPAFKGRVTVSTEWRDTTGLILLAEGKDPAKATKDDVLAVIERLDKAARSGQLRRFTGSDYTTDLAKGNVWIAGGYSGDIAQLQSDNPNLRFAIPDAGAIVFADNYLIPKHAKEPYGAETFVNYTYDPVVAAKLAKAIGYFSPVRGAQEEVAKTDPKLAANPLIFPDAATLARLHPYPTFSDADEREITAAMQRVTGA